MRFAVIATAVSLCVVGVSAASDTEAAIRKPINIPAQGLGSALQALAKDSGFQVVYLTDAVDPLRTQGAVGEFTPEEALKKLLHGTGLTYRYLDEKTVTIFPMRAPSSQDDSGGASTRARGQDSEGAGSADKEGKKNFFDRFRLAQADQGQSSSPSAVEKRDEQTSKKKPVVLEEVIVTGSRLRRTATEGPQEVKVYTRERIEQSGQTGVAEFLNTLPSVAQMSSEAPGGTSWSSTVQLHGLPVGSTLVLVDGRRVGVSAFQEVFNQANFVDLNSIPLAMVQRIEVVSEGSSAVYGSDAIGGVVNIILKKAFDGFEGSAKYGGATGTDDMNTSLAWGKRWNAGSLTMTGSFQSRSELIGSERALTASQNYTQYGGRDARNANCNPGNVYSIDGSNLPGVGAPYAAVPVGFAGPPAQSEFASTAARLNKCSFAPYSSLIPATRRAGFLALGSYNLTPSVELFGELFYSHVEEMNFTQPNSLFGVPRFQSFKVSASNPYNPFGEVVGISNLLSSVGRVREPLYTTFFRPLLGIRGALFNGWRWEVAGWTAHDRSTGSYENVANSSAVQSALNSSNPATALNPFIDGPLGPTQLLQSFLYGISNTYAAQTNSVDASVDGPLLTLSSGTVQVVIGGEYDRDGLSYNDTFNTPPTATFHRNRYAAFTEARIPLLANHTQRDGGDTLAVTLAARYDRYDDFGSKTTPQFGAEWRPTDTLLIRGTYGKAFKAPSLEQLYSPTNTYQSVVNDPLNGGQTEGINITYGGNPSLKPETGQSRTIGVVYSSKVIRDLQVSITHWSVDENNSIQELDYQTIANNPNLFPGAVVRAPTCASGPPCPITLINDGFVNFGAISVAGLDYRVGYEIRTHFGEMMPSMNATQTYHYAAALTPNVPQTGRAGIANDDGNWAPRWKGIVAFGWKLGPYFANVDGRYVGRYQDYDALPNGSTLSLGKFWLWDANFRYAVGAALAPTESWLKGTYVQLGAVNLFNTLPQFSNHFGGFNGFDPSEGDIRGRFVYVQVRVTL